jgi:hypothetical protein
VPSAVLADFRDDFEAEHLRWLRRRFLWFTGTTCALLIGLLAFGAWTLFVFDRDRAPPYMRVGAVLAIAAQAVVFALALRAGRSRAGPSDRAGYLRLVKWLIIASTVLVIVPSMALSPTISALAREWSGVRLSIGSGALWMLSILGLHLVASLLMPWTAREALAPVKPFVVLSSSSCCSRWPSATRGSR